MRAITISTIAEFVSEIIQIRETKSGTDEYPDIWFRGINNENLTLSPGAYWRPNCDEYSLAATFRALSPMLVNPKPTTDWDWYYLMQHFGIPTRLLDWTESPLQALHFAVNTHKSGVNPCVWVLDPTALNWTTQSQKNIIYVPDSFGLYKEIDNWLPQNCWKGHTPQTFECDYLKSNEKPIAIYPNRSNARLFAQRGTFTIHGTDDTPLDQIVILNPGGTEGLSKIIIDHESAHPIERDLWALGFSKSATYPEPQYVAEDVKLLYGVIP